MLAGHLVTASAQIPHFLPTVSYPAPGASMAVLADFNGDGFLDVVTANGFSYTGAGVSLLLGKANGAFQSATTLVAAGNPSWIVAGDFNNDGRLDIAIANEPDPNFPPPVGGPSVLSVSLLLGNGDGTFQAPIDTTTLGARFMASGDFNGDGKLDLAITGTVAPVQILLGNGDGTFSVSTAAVNGESTLIFVGDFNKDGKQDLLTGGWQMLGNGDGTFTFGQSLPNSGLVAVADFDGDGIPDLAGLARSFPTTTGAISFGLTDGTWAPSFISNFNAIGNMVAADFDGDGKQDLFGAGKPAQGINPDVGGLFLGGGTGFFTLATSGFGFSLDGKDLVGYPSYSSAGDLDHNGSPDIVIAAGTGILVARNTFGNPPLLAQMALSSATVVGGSQLTGTVSLGAPAPAGGATVALTSSSASATFPNGKTVLIPAGAQSSTFTIATQGVTGSTPVTITGTYNSVKQSAKFSIVPPASLTSVSLSPASLIGLFGGAPATGTVTLSGPAPDGTLINLTSSSPSAMSVPATVAVPSGSTTATFTVTAMHVAADTPVTVSAVLGGTTSTGTLTVRQETASITVTKAEYTVSKSQLKVEANSSDRVATLQVFNPTTGALVGNIPLVGVGKFSGQLTVTGSFTSAAVQSSVGGLSIVPVVQK